MKTAYDIVVLGAGAAGCAAARSLALTFPTASVALVEQGCRDTPTALSHIPMLQPFIPHSRKMKRFLRHFTTEPETQLGGRCVPLLRGCGLGGSTLINDMLYMRASKADMLSWADPLWTFETLLPLYKALEANRREGAMHGEGGPIPVSDAERSNVDSSMNVRFFEACESAGVNPVDDFNTGDPAGYSACQSWVSRGSRADVFNCLLESSKHMMPNLSVLTGLRAERLVFADQSTPRAEGVQLRGVDSKALQTLSAKQVVVCLGAIDTPALLLRSGVGPKGSVVDLPGVGQNLIQGTTVDLIFRLKNPSGVYSKSFSTRNAAYVFRQWQEYKEDRTGVFSSFLEAMSVISAADTADVSLAMLRTPHVGMTYKWPADGFTFRVTHHYPKSRGSVSLPTSKVSTETVVRGGLFSDRHDVEAMDQGMQFAGLLVSKELRSVYYLGNTGEHVGPFWSYDPLVVHPAKGLSSQEDTALFLSENAVPTSSAYGTCALGEVVDSQLRLKGVEGVNIADSSIVPQPTIASSSVLGSVIGSRVAQFI